MSDYCSLFAWWHSNSVYGGNSSLAVLSVARNKEIYTAMPSNGASDMTGDSSDSLVIFYPTILFSPIPDIPHSTHYTPSHFLPDPIIPSSSTPMAISMKPWSYGKRNEHWAHSGKPDALSWLSWLSAEFADHWYTAKKIYSGFRIFQPFPSSFFQKILEYWRYTTSPIFPAMKIEKNLDRTDMQPYLPFPANPAHDIPGIVIFLVNFKVDRGRHWKYENTPRFKWKRRRKKKKKSIVFQA